MTPEQLTAAIEWAQKIGPILLSILGSVNAAVLGLIGWGIRWAWRKHQERQAKMADGFASLAAVVEQMQRERAAEALAYKEAMQAIRTEVAISVSALRTDVASVREASDRTTREVAGVAAVCKLQQDELGKTNANLARVSGQLEAVFRFIDAPKRRTDVNGAGG